MSKRGQLQSHMTSRKAEKMRRERVGDLINLKLWYGGVRVTRKNVGEGEEGE